MKAYNFLLLLLCAVSHAQSPDEVLKWINTARADNNDFYYEIPFEYRNNEIVIEVGIGDKKYDYIFDTGGYNNITDAIQEENKLPVLTTQTVGSSNKLKSKINIEKADTLTIGGLIFRDVAVLQMDFSKSPTIQCTINGGLIGASIIKNYLWQIDYPNKKLIVTDQKDRLLIPAGAIRMPVTFNSRLMPYIEMQIGGRIEKVMFDTGSSTLFSMTKKTARHYHKTKEAIVIEGGGTEGGNGTIKENIRAFKAPLIGIGALKFEDKPVLYTDSNNENLIGNPIIQHYIVTLNFGESEMYFMPIAASPPEQGWKSFGFTLGQKEGHIKVVTLYKSLAAEKAGLRLEDIITGIDGQDVTCTDVCECKKMFTEKLAGADALTLTVLRDGKTIDLFIKKEKVF